MIRFSLTPWFSLENYGVAAAGFRTKGFPQMKTGEEESLFKLNDLPFSEGDTTTIDD